MIDGAHAGEDLLELVVGRTSGSPPLIITSRTSGERSMYLMALSISVWADESSVPPTRRRRVQWRQYIEHMS